MYCFKITYKFEIEGRYHNSSSFIKAQDSIVARRLFYETHGLSKIKIIDIISPAFNDVSRNLVVSHRSQ